MNNGLFRRTRSETIVLFRGEGNNIGQVSPSYDISGGFAIITALRTQADNNTVMEPVMVPAQNRQIGINKEDGTAMFRVSVTRENIMTIQNTGTATTWAPHLTVHIAIFR